MQTWGRTSVLLVSGPWGRCVWRTAGPPSKKKDFGHSGIFLNNTSPDPDASLPNPALQRLFDLPVFSSRANENAPANMEVLPSGLAFSQHAHLVSASASASASASVRRHRPPPPLLPPPPPLSKSTCSGTPPTARPVAGFPWFVSSSTSCPVRPFPGWRCWIPQPNPLLI